MQLRIKIAQGDTVVYLGRIKGRWVVSDRPNTEEGVHAAILEASGDFSVKRILEDFKNFRETYAYIQPGERS